MKKIIIAFTTLIVTFFALSICTYGSTSDSVNELFKVEVDQALMGKSYKAPHVASDAGEENINTMNGALNISATDISLPGINGMDVNIVRTYNNQNTDKKYYIYTTGNSFNYTGEFVAYKYRDIATQQIYYIGFYSEQDMFDKANSYIYTTTNFTTAALLENRDSSSSNYDIPVYVYRDMPIVEQENATITLQRVTSGDNLKIIAKHRNGSMVNRIDEYSLYDLPLGNGFSIQMPHLTAYGTNPTFYQCDPNNNIYCPECWNYDDEDDEMKHSCETDLCEKCNKCEHGPERTYSSKFSFKDMGGNIINVNSILIYRDGEFKEASTYSGNKYTVSYPVDDFGNILSVDYVPNMIDVLYSVKITDNNGNSMYFDARSYDGYMTAYQDRYGNYLKYEYGSVGGYKRLKTIYDTLGRRIHFNWDANGEYVDNITVADLTAGTETKTIQYIREVIPGADDSIECDDVYRLKVVNPEGQTTIYESSKHELYFADGRSTETVNAYNLNKIIHPTGAETLYTYEKGEISFSYGTPVSYEKTDKTYRFKLTKRTDKLSSSSDEINKAEYTYDRIVGSPQKDVESYILSDEVPNYTTFLKQGETGAQISNTYTYHENELSTDNLSLGRTKLYEYVDFASYTLPSKVTTSDSNYSTNKHVVQTYEYNNYGDVTKETRDNEEITYEYDKPFTDYYDPGYGLLKKTIVKRDTDKYTVTENVLDSTRKNVATQKVYDRLAGVDTLKEERQYQYNAQGEVTNERTRIDNNNWKTTSISYEYSTSSSEIQTNLQTPLKTDTGTRDMLKKTTVVTNVSNIADSNLQGTTQNIEIIEVYDFFGNLGLTKDGNAGITVSEYDKLNRVKHITYPDNSTVSYNYYLDANTNRVDATDEEGHITRYYYDPLGRYQKASMYIPQTNSETVLEEVEYDELGRISCVKKYREDNGSHQVCLYTYDKLNRVVKEEIRDSSKTGNILRQKTYAYSRSTAGDDFSKDTMQTKIGIYDNGEMVYLYTYDNMYGDRMREEVNVTKNGNNEYYTSTYSYDINHNLIAYKDFKSNRNPFTTVQYEYDYAGRVVKEINEYNQARTMTYDSAGRMIAETDFAGKTVTYAYNNLDLQTQMLAPFEGSSKSEVQTVYDRNGNPVKSRVKTDTNTYRETYSGYDRRNRLVYSAYNEDDGSKTYTQYGYTPGGNVKIMVTGLSSLMANPASTAPSGAAQTRYLYDVYGNLKSLTFPDGNIIDYEYDLFGNVTKEMYPDGQISYTYSPMGEMLSMTGTRGSESKTYTYQYDTQGRRTLATYDGKTIATEYDEIGRLTKETENRLTGSNIVKEYSYDSAHNVETFKLIEGNETTQNVLYNYDFRNRMVKVTDLLKNDEIMAEYTYDNNDNVVKEMLNNSQYQVNYTYNLGNMVTYMENKIVSDNTVQSSYYYTYNPAGERLSENAKTYSYDSAGRLKTTYEHSQAMCTYTYDRRGNRVLSEETVRGINRATCYTYNINNQLVWEETMTNSENTGCIHYTYDLCGNLYSKAIDKFEDIQNGQTSIVTGEILGASDTTDTTIYEYDVFNRMDMMSDNGKEWTFEYNADGQRVSKSNGIQSLEYIWDGNNIVSEKNENNQSTYFQRGLSLLTMEREQDNFKHYYFKNAHGDVTGVVDTRTNTIKYSYDYDAFGNQILESATNTNIFSSGYNGEVEDTNPFRYAGEYFDREVGMIYLRNRYYIPDYGRFTQQDTHWNPSNMIYGDENTGVPNLAAILQSSNLYVYCGNNAVNRIDISGLEWGYIRDFANDTEMLFGTTKYDFGYGGVRITSGGGLHKKSGMFYFDGYAELQTYGGRRIETKKVANNDNGNLYLERTDFYKAMNISYYQDSFNYTVTAEGNFVLGVGISIAVDKIANGYTAIFISSLISYYSQHNPGEYRVDTITAYTYDENGNYYDTITTYEVYYKAEGYDYYTSKPIHVETQYARTSSLYR